MQTFPIFVGTALVALTLATAAPAGTVTTRATAEYAAGVTQICKGALLFEGAQAMGTRADALAIAQGHQRVDRTTSRARRRPLGPTGP